MLPMTRGRWKRSRLFGSLAARIRQFLDPFLPKADLVFFPSAPLHSPEPSLGVRVDLERRRWLQQAILNDRRELEKAHYLGNSGSRNPLAGRDSGLVQSWILLYLLMPQQR